MLLRKFCLSFLLAYLFISFFVQNSFAFPKVSKSSSQDSLPTVLKANEVTGDQVKNVIVAKGNVEVRKGSSTLYADKITYAKNDGIIKALGDVRVKNIEIGNLKASKAEVKDDFSSGAFYDGRLFMSDGSYLFSSQIDRETPLITVLQKPIYSFCPNAEIGADNDLAGKKRDMFSIKSRRTTIDREKELIKIKGGTVRFYDVPFFYTPFLQTSLPSKKRQSGFLHPSYTKSTNLGLGIKIPYYLNIAENMDLTMTPRVSVSSDQLMIKNEFRHLTSYGEYSTNLELANNKISNSTSNYSIGSDSTKKYRWHLDGKGVFDFTNNAGLDFSLNTVSDRNYLRNYYFNYLNHTYSKVNFDYIKGRDYYAVKAIRFQELENSTYEKAAPLVLPSVDTHYETKPFFSKDKFVFGSNMTVISRQDGLQYRRVSAVPEVVVPFNLNGNLFAFDAKVQSDFYSLDNNFQYTSRTNDYNQTQNSYKPETSFSWKLPLIKKLQESTFLIEPTVKLVSSSYSKNFAKLPNEDSNSSELTVSNIFISDRVSGFDRNESGERASFGAKSSYFNKYGEFGLTVGQSYRRSENEQDVAIRGFNDNNKSNIVGQALYKAKKYFSIFYLFQLNESSYNNEINQLSTSLDFDRITFSSDYLLLKESNQNSTKKEQITFSSSVKLNDRWKVTLTTSRNIVLGRNLSRGITFYRDGCCTTFGFSIVENNPSVLSKAQKTFNLNLSFKNL